MSDGSLFLTGITGALGSWIAGQALADGLPVRALARAAGGCSAEQRIERSLSITSNQSPITRWEAVEGDIHDRQLDLGDSSLVIHCAACTAFDERSAVDSHRTNVEGLQNILELCTRKRLPLVHISTAYVSGKRTGHVHENELLEGQQFNNVYERTKCAGETLVRDWSSQSGIPAIILRPSIVLGDWELGRSVRFNTLYHLMAALDSVGPPLGRQTLRLVGRADVTKNIIPVDYFAQVAWQIIRQRKPGTFQIVHPNPITMGELGEIFSRLFNLDLKFVAASEFDSTRATPIERMCGRIMAPYRPYMLNDEPVFRREATQAAIDGSDISLQKLDADYFKRLLDYGRLANWGRGEADQSVSDKPANQASEYFERFLAGRMNQTLLPDLKHLTARFSIAMKDCPALSWTLDVQGGALKSITRRSHDAACSFTLDTRTFLQIASAELSPKQAFFKGRIKIAGNVELGLKVATVLTKFFTAYPFQMVSI